MDLTDEQWEIVSSLIPAPKRREDGRGRPWRDPPDVLHGILWVLRMRAPWKDLLRRCPPYQTCHRRFQQWSRDGTLRRILEALAEDLYRRGRIDLREAFANGTLAGAKKGPCVGKTKRGKGIKIMAVSDRSGLPIPAGIASASPHEVTLAEATLDQGFLQDASEYLIGDRAYDSDPLDARLRHDRGITFIAPHRCNPSQPKTQDGRRLRGYGGAGRSKGCSPGFSTSVVS